ncbi:MAG: flagellar hook assembly protein FlgD [Hyphomicrobium zavarzinii]|jgi:flagellar basal-body rod modification protein FlgD|uniref:flagellar hook assembly protein FlgD n=1 Tax=Hyphomicrobium TaxID=81 RepID=UPI0003753425|nr:MULTISPECIES: flagellar hook assembly protein FlgD [Hyphomicrobium]MBL8847790.1 flagellar hook assembly protein FlgD [Hyphomicrobium zavarzinii]WBT39241.1 flagellar hook assembly protein FlgD [Hyphomicrobium sp. DMF-1]HML43034.1 flagellar hook assembly protein FlgD [Hyphomicrobium zavarzinii]
MDVGSSTSTSSNQQTNNSSSTSSSSSTSGTSTLGYDAFLKLLTAQMKFQDPTKPMDSTQFVAQLASFSNVEQAMKTNTKLDSLITSLALNQADGLIGKTVTSADGSVSGKVASVRIVSTGAVAVLESGKEIVMEAGVKVS